MSEDIFYADATTLARRIRDRSLSPVEVVQAHLDRIEAVNPGLNALIAFPDGVMDRAREAEAAFMRGESWGLLHGVPFTVKDCVDTAGVVTTRGSRLFETHVPTADATVVRRLKGAGGIFIAKSNMPEFALWWETDNLVYGAHRESLDDRTHAGRLQRWRSRRRRLGHVAAGHRKRCRRLHSRAGELLRHRRTQGTHGRIPLTGHWPETLLRFMHVGPIVRSVGDAALALNLMAGPDGIDHYALPVPLPELSQLARLPGCAWPGAPKARSHLWTKKCRTPSAPRPQRWVSSAARSSRLNWRTGKTGQGSRFPPGYSPRREAGTWTR